MLLIAVSNAQAFVTVTTAVGRGADTYLTNDGQEGPTVNRGTSTSLRAFRILPQPPAPTGRIKIGYIRFDLSDVGGDLTGATLTFEATKLKGTAKDVNVYGLIDGVKDTWPGLTELTINYNNAPGVLSAALANYRLDFNNVTLLGKITTPPIPSPAVYPVRFSSFDVNLPLGGFLNLDTNKLVTFLFMGTDNEGEIASKEHATFLKPTLTLPNAFPLRAYNPNPANVSIVESTTSVLLQWQRGAYAAQHDIYFGSNWTDVNNAKSSDPCGLDKVYKARQSVDANSYPVTGLIQGINYYWRIDEVNTNAGAPAGSPWKGTIWSFKILPRIAWNPTPPDGAGLVAPKITLRWRAGSGAVTGHRVYLSDIFTDVNNAPPGSTAPPYKTSLTPTSDPNWSPAKAGITLGLNKIYYWRIDEYNGVTTTYKGNVWRFTTVPNAPPDPNLVGWWRFDNDANDSSGHWYHGTASSDLSPPILPTYIDDLQLYTGGREISLAGNNYKQYVDLPIGTLISSLTSSTFALWVNVHVRASTVRWQKFFDFGTNTTNYVSLRPHESSSSPTHFEITTGGTTNRVGWGTNTGGTPGGSALPLNEWHHVAVTISAPSGGLRTYRLYVDSQEVGINTACTLTPSSAGVTTSNWLGKSIDLTVGGLYIESYLDDFRIYDRALSQSEILKLASPSVAWNPKPADNATDTEPTLTLKWNWGNQAAKHDVYFSDNWAAVNDANSSDPCGPTMVYKGRQDPNKYDITTQLEFETTYYWRIDEVNLPNMWPGSIWSFTTGNYLVVDDFEDYNNTPPNRISDAWIKSGGGTVGNPATTIIHGGGQSMPFDYNNLTSFYDSNATRTFATDQNWAAKGVKALSLWFRGYPPVGSFTRSASPPYIYTMTASGTDINVQNSIPPAGFHDEFHYAYIPVSGECDIIARVDSLTASSSAQSKAGVMIRDSLADNSAYAMVYRWSGSNGLSFEYRPVAGQTISPYSVTVAQAWAPTWLWLRREWNGYYEWTGYYSAKSEPNRYDWTALVGYDNIELDNASEADTVYIGLIVTARNAAATCTAVFSNISITDGTWGDMYSYWPDVRGNPVTLPWPWPNADISIKSNTAAPLYVTLQDGSTPPKTKIITHPDPNIALQSAWQAWDIALSDFTGVDPTKIKKITIGLGNKIAHQGAGTLYFDDIRLYIPKCVLLKRSADFAKTDYAPAAGDCTVDYQEIGTMASNWLRGTVSTADEIWLEAENANTMGPLMKVYSDRADASGGEYIAVVPGTPSEPNNPNANGIATYNFTVKGGVYKVLGRAVAPSGTEDSFWYRIQTATTQIIPPNPNGWIFWDVAEAGNNWAWDDLNSDPNGDATVQFTMSAGTHTLEIAYRERTLLDCLLITDNLGLDQATLPPWGADLNSDKRIDIKDFALLANQWLIEQLWP
jgi:hypothetical protein